MMMKKLITVLACLLASITFSQTGVNTLNPQGVLHVDGGGSTETTNPTSGSPSSAQAKDDFIITSSGKVGIGTINPSSKVEIISDNENESGLKLTNLKDVQYIGTDAEGNIIKSGESATNGVLVSKQRLQNVSPSLVLTVPSGDFSFRYSATNYGGYWQIRYNGAGTRSITTFVTEHWTSNGYSVSKGIQTLNSGAWVNIPGSTQMGSVNELNIFRVYDLQDGITYRFEANLVEFNNNIKESMIVEQF